MTHFDMDDNEAGILASRDKLPIGLEDRLRTYFRQSENVKYLKMTPA